MSNDKVIDEKEKLKMNQTQRFLTITLAIIGASASMYIHHINAEFKEAQDFRETVAGHIAGTESKLEMLIMFIQGEIGGSSVAKK